MITVDNASNCDTMLEHLKYLLQEKDIPFSRDGNRVRYVKSSHVQLVTLAC